MKRIFLILTGLIVIALAAVCIFIPSKIDIEEEISIDASDVITAKFLVHENNWKTWWPGAVANDSLYKFKSLEIDVNKTTNSTVYFNLKNDDVILKSNITFFATQEGAVTVKWNAEGSGSNNIFTNFKNYFRRAAIKQQINDVLTHLKGFLQDERNTYGYKIYLNHVKDTVLLTYSKTRKDHPTINEIYHIVDDLKQQADKKGVKPTSFPMLNVTKTDEHEYQVTIALPISNTISTGANTIINKMPKGANLLVMDVKGGQNTINDALSLLKIYMKDHRLVSPAMPFESLITDRSAEKDTSKWVTKIYYPIL
ncbi:hypothetical protein MTO98_14855 [Mucilaginibacter sp. SMC90]|uniref:hypothetical protein n=1 Tax=Mucilaginibacter sp. SMC90 TaxID=2929803 RepID=UPI001FB1B6BF|nr:hypothetical protein [Mucilaginibacter sp. SMC90]UOE52358.1 hypothetical protein MTO98_14855 [Mucilaginibacter sp. SMC90]